MKVKKHFYLKPFDVKSSTVKIFCPIHALFL